MFSSSAYCAPVPTMHIQAPRCGWHAWRVQGTEDGYSGYSQCGQWLVISSDATTADSDFNSAHRRIWCGRCLIWWEPTAAMWSASASVPVLKSQSERWRGRTADIGWPVPRAPTCRLGCAQVPRKLTGRSQHAFGVLQGSACDRKNASKRWTCTCKHVQITVD